MSDEITPSDTQPSTQLAVAGALARAGLPPRAQIASTLEHGTRGGSVALTQPNTKRLAPETTGPNLKGPRPIRATEESVPKAPHRRWAHI